jgi:tetratricopeptide (TPR) repeat protein
VQRLQQAHQLAPWKPYYPYQLGWNLGNLSLQPSNQQQQLREGGISWLREAVKVSPYQEFGYTNLAWLLLDRDPKAATQAFARSAQLIPAKRGVFYGLGLSLLAEGKTDLAVEALSLELLRDPLLITSPIWQTPELQPIYARVTKQLEAKYTELLAKYPQPGFLNSYLHQSRGGLRWWRGDLTAARADWERYGSQLSQLVLAVSEGKYFSGDLQQLPPAIAAWFDPIRRPQLLQQAWIQANRAPAPTGLMQQFFTGMVGSTTFDQWVKENAPIRQYRRERAGFGVLSRHIDGPLPTDFLPVVENVVMSNFFKELLPSQFYAPQLDLALQPWRDELLKQVVYKLP